MPIDPLSDELADRILSLRNEIQQLKALNARLLAACQAFLAADELPGAKAHEKAMRMALAMAEDAVAKATEGKGS